MSVALTARIVAACLTGVPGAGLAQGAAAPAATPAAPAPAAVTATSTATAAPVATSTPTPTSIATAATTAPPSAAAGSTPRPLASTASAGGVASAVRAQAVTPSSRQPPPAVLFIPLLGTVVLPLTVPTTVPHLRTAPVNDGKETAR